ncbi:MAG: IS630 transposase-related protein [Gammaproteobacteria bacterium]|nr:IS630 transposase-related protein [Gammaproteobacteria bacterium]
MKRKQYSNDLRATVLGEVKNGRTVRSVSDQFGISVATIYSWHRNQVPQRKLSYKEMEKRMNRLIKENESLKEDVEILGKATAWFVQNGPATSKGRTSSSR